MAIFTDTSAMMADEKVYLRRSARLLPLPTSSRQISERSYLKSYLDSETPTG